MIVSRRCGRIRAAARRGSAAGLFLALTLTAGAARGGDNAAFAGYSGVPDLMLTGEKARVTVTMLNNGTTTWAKTVVTETEQQTRTTTTTTYALKSVGDDWGVSGVAVTGSVAPNKRRGFQFTITAPAKDGTYVFQWRMDRNTVVVERPVVPAKGDDGFGATTPRKLIVVEKDAAPSFGKQTIPNQTWTVKKAIKALTLPNATGGNGKLNYSFNCKLPTGVRQRGRLISGTPTIEWPKTTCTWKVTDSDSNTAESDSDKLTFTITVGAPKAPKVIVVSVPPPEILKVKEGESETFTVKLGAKPTGSVRVSVKSADPAAAGVGPKTLAFTTGNYGTTQTVTVTGVQDEDVLHEKTTVALNASGGGYGGVTATVYVEVKDDDTPPPPIVEPAALTVSEGASGTLKVSLPTQPRDDVTVTVTSGLPAAASVSPSSLTFNSGNYARKQPVSVTGLRDTNTTDKTLDVVVKASGGGYDEKTSMAKAAVTVEDDDVPDLVVSPTKPEVAEGGSASFTVKLATKTTRNVTVSVTNSDTGALSVSPASFSLPNDAVTRTVTVTGRQDVDANDETVKLTLASTREKEDKSKDKGKPVTVDVTVKDNDKSPENPALVVDPTSLGIGEGASGKFTVKLATRPSGKVTVSLTNGDAGALTVNRTSLTFGTSSYATNQTVTVTGRQDDDAFDERVTVDLSASGGGYRGVSAAVTVTVKDDEEAPPPPVVPALLVSPSSLGIEEGGSKTFTVKLATQPSGKVTVSVASGDAGAASVSSSSLTFNATSYATARTVTVTGEHDDDTADESTRIGLSASGGGYGGVSASVRVAVKDDDEPAPENPGLTLSRSSLGIDEGGSGAFTVALSAKPSGPVTVSATSGDLDAASVGPVLLSFTAADYDSARTVTVEGEQDADAKHEETAIVLSASGGGYDKVSASVSVTVRDDEAPALLAVPEKLEIDEGDSGAFSVKLATKPEGAVLVSISVTSVGAGSVNPPGLTFTPTDYARPRTVPVPTPHDADARDERLTVALTASGGGYDGLSASVEVTVKDDEAPALVTSVEKLDVAEGESDAFTVKLATPPSGRVTVSVTSDDAAAVSVTPSSLSFTASDYGSIRKVRVTGAQDADAANEETAVTLSASGGGYDNAAATVEVSVKDDDEAALVAVPEKLSIEEGASGAFEVKLASAPTGAVTVSVTSGDIETATVTPSSLTFTAADYGTARKVTVTGEKDANRRDREVAVRLSASGGDYGGAALSVGVTVTEPPYDEASFVSYVDLPSAMTAGTSTTVTVRMKNTGTTTWTSAAGYALGSRQPADNVTWGVKRVAPPAAVAPGSTVDFRFKVTAPAKAGDHKFQWRMVRGADGWFGAASKLRGIAVEKDVSPSFGSFTIDGQTWTKDVRVVLDLPKAEGGNGKLTYALSGKLPAGVTFDVAARVLVGTPTATRAAAEYTYTATDADGDAATLTFTIEVRNGVSDDASFVAYVDVPSTMTAGSSAWVTVRMKNTGTSIWNSVEQYALGSPGDANWGLSRVAVLSNVLPNAAVDFRFKITAPPKANTYEFRWRMMRGGKIWFGDETTPRRIKVSASTSESSTAPAGGFDMFEYWLLPHGSGMRVRSRLGDGGGGMSAPAGVRSFWRGELWGRKVALLGGPGGERYDIFEETTDGLAYWGAFEGGADDRYADAVLRDEPVGGADGRYGDAPVRDAPVDGADDMDGDAVIRAEPVGAADDPAGAPAPREGVFERSSSWSLDRPFRWMNRFMKVGDALESEVTGHLLSDRGRNQEAVVETTMRLEVLSHRASFTIPAADGPMFEDVLAVRFWPDVERPEVHETFHLARGFGAVHWRRAEAAWPEAAPMDEAPHSSRLSAGSLEEVVEWWAVDKVLAPIVPSAPAFPWYDPFSPGWPKTAVLNGNLEDERGHEAAVSPGRGGDYAGDLSASASSAGEGGVEQASFSPAPGWRADSGDAVVGPTPPGLAGGSRSLLLRGSEAGGDTAADAATTGDWIPVAGGTYRLSACMLRANAADNVVVDLGDGVGRDGDFADAHLVASSTGAWECRAIARCIPASVGAVRVRAARTGANLGDAWFDRIELKRVAACAAPGSDSEGAADEAPRGASRSFGATSAADE